MRRAWGWILQAEKFHICRNFLYCMQSWREAPEAKDSTYKSERWVGILGTLCMCWEVIPDCSLGIHVSCVVFQNKRNFLKVKLCQKVKCVSQTWGAAVRMFWGIWRAVLVMVLTGDPAKKVNACQCCLLCEMLGFFSFIGCFLLSWGGAVSFHRQGKLTEHF